MENSQKFVRSCPHDETEAFQKPPSLGFPGFPGFLGFIWGKLPWAEPPDINC